MLWSDHVGWYPQPVIYVLLADGTFLRFDDRFDPAEDPVEASATPGGETPGGEIPPSGRYEPAYGFGKLWREQPGVREQLGWATAEETPGAGWFQMFLGGNMIWISQTDQTYVLISESQTVSVFDTPFSTE